MPITLTIETQDAQPPLEGWLDHHLQRIAHLQGVGDAMISVAVVDDATMTELHERYRQEAGTTDVLTFDLRTADAESVGPEPIEGEIVICIDEAARQAGRLGRETRLEVLLYAVHGLLHLSGYDDVTPQQAQRMHQREDELLTEAGIGPLYHERMPD